MAHKMHRSLQSPFVKLLSGRQPVWLDMYRKLAKVKKCWDSGIMDVIYG